METPSLHSGAGALPLPRGPRWGLLVICVYACLGSLGCYSSHVFLIEIPVAELAASEPIAPVPLGRARVSFDRPLPGELVQPLSPEFSLILARRPDQWRELRERLHLSGTPTELDLENGAVVGIQADVGRYAGRDWPIRLVSTRVYDGFGWVEALFANGIYYPLKTASYVELAYVPGLKFVAVTTVNDRTFVIGNSPPPLMPDDSHVRGPDGPVPPFSTASPPHRAAHAPH